MDLIDLSGSKIPADVTVEQLLNHTSGIADDAGEEYSAPFCIYKEGSNDGVSAIFCYYPSRDLTLTLLSNQDCNVWKMKREDGAVSGRSVWRLNSNSIAK